MKIKLIVLLVLMIRTVFAYNIVDEFDTPVSDSHTSWLLPTFWTDSGSDDQIIGGQRFVYLNRSNIGGSPFATFFATSTVDFDGRLLAMSSNQYCSSELRLVYNNSYIADWRGLDRVKIRFSSATNEPDFTEFTTVVVNDGTTYSYDGTDDLNAWFNENISNLQAGQARDFYVLFDDLDLSDPYAVTDIRFTLIGEARNLDYSLDFVVVTSEASTAVCSLLAAVAMFLVRWRIKKKKHRRKVKKRSVILWT